MTDDDPLDFAKTLDAPAAARGGYSLAPGDRLGQYRVVKPLGRGGMGEVYLCEHAILTTRHAVKLLPAERSASAGFLQRFHDEARVMARLDHPGIVKVTHADSAGDRHYLVMEFVGADGTDAPFDLEDALDAAPDNRLPPETVARLCGQVAEAVGAAHSAGVVHRDLKPANVLLTGRDLAAARARVTDFGLARLLGEDWVRSQADASLRRSLSLGDQRTQGGSGTGSAPDHTSGSEGSSSRALLGTYEYMSPEQREGREVDARSDVYALGVMLYRLLTGKRLMGRAKAASKLVAGLDPEWDSLIDACLEEAPAERPQAMVDVAARLGGLAAAEARRRVKEEAEAAARAEQERQRLATEERLRSLARQREDAARKKAEDEKLQADEAHRLELERDAARRREDARREEELLRKARSKRGGGGRLARAVAALLLAGAAMAGLWVFRGSVAGVGDPGRGPGSWMPPTESPGSAPPASGRTADRDWTSPATGMEFVWVPTLKLWVGKYEVTNGEYRQKEAGHDSQAYGGPSLNGDRQPVVCVNFDDAKAYAAWLTQRDGAQLGGLRYRLPSNEEFMAYAQCGDRREYPWGTSFPPRSGQAGNYADAAAKGAFTEWGVIEGYDDGSAVSCDVDKSWANPWRLFGVGGNVWEACASDTSGGSFGAWRGASWYNYIPFNLRCSIRIGNVGSYRDVNYGFRLVLSR